MIKSVARAVLAGGSFDPDSLPPDLALVSSGHRRKGEIGKYGRQPALEGSVIVQVPSSENCDPLLALVDKLYACRNQIVARGIEYITIYLDVLHDGQCNFEFAPDLLGKISELRAVLAITTAQESDPQERS